MIRLHSTLLNVSLLHMALWAQANPHEVLRDALNLENHENFEPAAKIGKLAIDCGQLAGTELGRAYIILGVAYQGEGSLIDAQIAYERVVHILEGDPDHLEEYAAALENYAGYYTDLAQLEIAVPHWPEAFHLRPRIGDHFHTAQFVPRSASASMGIVFASINLDRFSQASHV